VRDVKVTDDEVILLATTGDSRWREARDDDWLDMGVFTNSVIDVYSKSTGELLASAEFNLDGEFLFHLLDDRRVVGRRSTPTLDHLVVWELTRVE